MADGRYFAAPGVSIANLGDAGGILGDAVPRVVEIDVSSVPANALVVLSLDLLGFGAADSRVGVSILVEGAWVEGQVAAVDSMGVVLESPDGNHAVIRVDRIAAVKVHSESPFRAQLTPYPTEPLAATVPGPRTAED